MKYDVASILETFVQLTPKKLANPEHWVLIDPRTGKHLQLLSKKKNWNRIGHAKTALLCHIEGCQAKKKWGERLSDKEIKALADTLLQEGHLKLVNLLAKPEEEKKEKKQSKPVEDPQDHPIPGDDFWVFSGRAIPPGKTPSKKG